ncbi:putative heterokaryon incompatibility [Rosellinia necatrix]|uniref:Putative heterokaryon incompatibility n=1 Tax=Rosellinia necatrix TaxID=77044 RepID=A0A1W2TTX5_ROSNE|nr:putative heterokaryon incompatibility [Rosellinia necatrix]
MDKASKTQANLPENQLELSQAELSRTQVEQVPANPQTRKRPLDSDNNAESRTKRSRTTRPTLKPARLTRKNLAEFNNMGEKKTSDPTDASLTTTKTTLTTTSGFAIQARNNGILDPIDSKPPKNLEDIRKRQTRSRATASPPEPVYRHYANKVWKAPNEATIVVEASGNLLKEYDGKGYDRVFNQAFTGLPKNMGFNDGLSAPQPDFVEGPEMGEFRPFPIASHVPGAPLYRDNPHSVTLPHIAGEWKGPDGSMRIAELQSAYDGAALVHARNQALAYMGQSDPPGHAEITTFTTDGTTLNHYAHYAAPSAEDPDALEYHQYHVLSINLTSTYQGHKDGRKSLRNAQDHAKTQSEQLRDQLKQHWKQNRNQLPPVAEGVHPPDVEPPLHATAGYKDASPHVPQVYTTKSAKFSLT